MIEQRIIIKPLEPRLFDQWLPLWQGYLEFYKVEISDAITRSAWDRFFDEAEMIYAIGAFRDGKLLGFAHYNIHRSTWTDGYYCYLEDLFTDERARGLGVGRSLIEAVQEIARDKKCLRLYWVTDKGNERARALYDSCAELSDFVQYRISLDK